MQTLKKYRCLICFLLTKKILKHFIGYKDGDIRSLYQKAYIKMMEKLHGEIYFLLQMMSY